MKETRSKKEVKEAHMAWIQTEAIKSDSGCWTLQANPEGDLDDPKTWTNCERSQHPEAGSGEDTSQAIDHLFGCLSSLKESEKSALRIANILGHGNDGYIITGPKGTGGEGQFIAWRNHDSWKDDLSRLRGKISLLRLHVSCPGVGKMVSNLLDYTYAKQQTYRV